MSPLFYAKSSEGTSWILVTVHSQTALKFIFYILVQYKWLMVYVGFPSLWFSCVVALPLNVATGWFFSPHGINDRMTACSSRTVKH